MEKRMYKVVTRILALTILGLLAFSLAPAQTAPAKFDIPFDFTVGKTSLPAGLYTVKALSDSVMQVESLARPEGVLVITHKTQGKTASENCTLTFHRYGEQYFMSSLKTPGSDVVREVMSNRHEKDLARRSSGAEILVAAR